MIRPFAGLERVSTSSKKATEPVGLVAKHWIRILNTARIAGNVYEHNFTVQYIAAGYWLLVSGHWLLAAASNLAALRSRPGLELC